MTRDVEASHVIGLHTRAPLAAHVSSPSLCTPPRGLAPRRCRGRLAPAVAREGAVAGPAGQWLAAPATPPGFACSPAGRCGHKRAVFRVCLVCAVTQRHTGGDDNSAALFPPPPRPAWTTPARYPSSWPTRAACRPAGACSSSQTAPLTRHLQLVTGQAPLPHTSRTRVARLTRPVLPLADAADVEVQVTAHHVSDKGKERTVFIIKFDKSVLAREEQLAASS